MIVFDFNIFLVLILIGIIIIGYTTGFVKEIKKLLNISLPLVVIFLWGRKITTWIYKTSQFQYIKEKIHFIDIQYFDTFIMLLLVLIIMGICYFITKTIVKVIVERFHLEVVKYKLGKFSNYLGALFSLVRFYIIASISVIPFYIFGFTSTNDITTKILANYPVPFSQISYVASEIEPVVEVTNSLKTLLEVIDINYLKAENEILTNLKTKLDEYENIIKDNCDYTPGDEAYPYLYAYLNDDNKEEYSDIVSYEGLIIWINEENLNLSTIDFNLLLDSYIDNFEEINANTKNQDVKLLLNESLNLSKIYLEVNNWLENTLGENYNIEDLYNDENMEIIMEQLVIDSSYDNKGLYYRLSTLNISELNEKLVVIKAFVKDYDKIYKTKLDDLNINTSFNYKMIALVLKEANYHQTLKNSPLFSTFISDTFKSWADKKYKIIYDESIYQTLIKVIIPLYYLEEETLTVNNMKKIIDKIDDALNKKIINEDFFLQLMKALVVSENDKSYLDYLIENDLISVEGVNVLENYFNNRFLNNNTDIVLVIKDAFSKEGEING